MEEIAMFDRSPESADPLSRAVVEAVKGSLTQEELEFGTQPNGELLGRYALEIFIERVSANTSGSNENR
jgi:hypothetical protein